MKIPPEIPEEPIFVTTAGFKLLSLSGGARILDASDGLTGIPNRWLYVLVAGIEL